MTVFRYSQGFYLFTYSPGQFFDTRTDSTFSRYSFEFCHFSVLTRIRPFSGTRQESFSILARILRSPSARLDFSIFRYSHGSDPFPVLTKGVFRYSHGFYVFPVLARILHFFGTHTDSTLFRYSPRQVFRYSHGFYLFRVLARILPFFST